MKALFYILWYSILIIFQTTFLNYAEIFNVKPNLMLIFVVLICYFINIKKGVIIGGIMGFLYDILVGKYIGLNTLMFMYIGFLICLFNEKVLKQPRILISVVSVFVFSNIVGLIYFLIHSLAVSEFNFTFLYMSIILPESIYSTIVSIPMYLLIKKTSTVLLDDKG